MKLNQKAEMLGVPEKDGVFRTEIKGFPIQLVEGNYMFNKIYFVVFILDGSISKESFDKVRKQNKLMMKPFIMSVVKNQNGLAYILRSKTKEAFNEFANQQIEIFKELGLKGLQGSIYKDGEVDGQKLISVQPQFCQYTLKDVWIPVNLEAFGKMYLEQVESIKQEDAKSENAVKSLALALLGAFIGAIPTSVIYALGYFSGWGFAIIPFASFYFYKLGKGPKAAYILIFITLFSFIASVAAIFINWQILAMDHNLTILDLFLYEPTAEIMLRELLMTVLFFAIGMVVSWQYLFRDTTAKKLKDLSNIK